MIASCSWMVNQTNSESWRHTILSFTNSATASISVLQQSWEVKPFVDVVVHDGNICPYDYPDDLIYEVWLGTRGLCSCLERDDDRNYSLDTKCHRGKNGEHKSEDCLDVAGSAPII